jgi:hypothetical protein
MVAVKKSAVMDRCAQLEPHRLRVKAVDADAIAIANAFATVGPLSDPSDRSSTAIIDIGHHKTIIVVMQGGSVLFVREVYLAGNEVIDCLSRSLSLDEMTAATTLENPGEQMDTVTDAFMPAVEDLVNEIRLSMDYVEGEHDTEVSRVVLSGGLALFPGIDAVVGNILGRKTMVFDPIAAVNLTPNAYDAIRLDAQAPSMAIVMGLALRGLDALPPSLQTGASLEWKPRMTSTSVDAPASTAMIPGSSQPAASASSSPVPSSTLAGTDRFGSIASMSSPSMDAFGSVAGTHVAPLPPPPPLVSSASSPAWSVPTPPGIVAPPIAPVPGTARIAITPVHDDGEDHIAIQTAIIKSPMDSGEYQDPNRSGMLVVIEDDEPNDDIPDQRIERRGLREKTPEPSILPPLPSLPPLPPLPETKSKP